MIYYLPRLSSLNLKNKAFILKNFSQNNKIISLAPRDHGFDSAEKACIESLQTLDCEYLDLYLIHWPGVQKLKSEDPRNAELRQESWKALEKLCKAG